MYVHNVWNQPKKRLQFFLAALIKQLTQGSVPQRLVCYTGQCAAKISVLLETKPVL